MNVLVTGSAGHLGSTLVPHLLSCGHRVRALDILRYGGEGLLSVWSHPYFEMVVGDIRDAALVEQSLEGIEAVVHLAAIVGAPACDIVPEATKHINHLATVHLSEQARYSRVPLFLFASTCSVYGSVPRDTLCTVDSPRQPLSLYAETKIAAEDGIMEHRCLGAYLPVILRFGTAYGLSPRMRFDTLINQFAMEAVLDGKLLVYRPDARRPYTHVRDIARAISTVIGWASSVSRHHMISTPEIIYNVGGHNRSKRDLAEMLKVHVPSLKVVYNESEDTDPRDYAVDFDNDELSKLGFSCRHSPETGLLELVTALQQGVFLDPKEGKWRNV